MHSGYDMHFGDSYVMVMKQKLQIPPKKFPLSIASSETLCKIVFMSTFHEQ